VAIAIGFCDQAIHPDFASPWQLVQFRKPEPYQLLQLQNQLNKDTFISFSFDLAAKGFDVAALFFSHNVPRLACRQLSALRMQSHISDECIPYGRERPEDRPERQSSIVGEGLQFSDRPFLD
jgi:hypothetical protein